MISLTIDGKQVQVREGLSIKQACEESGHAFPEIFRRLEDALCGVLRLSFVEIRGRDGVFDAGTERAAEGMEIVTDSPHLSKVRERAVRLMLARHPAECAVCEKSGDCLLQEACFKFGLMKGDCFETASSDFEKTETGPLVEMHPSRCVLCMKCLSFMNEVAGTPELALSGKGAMTRIKPFIKGAFSSPLSGNLIDLCPSGAFTDATAKVLFRPWQTERKTTTDVLDSFLPTVNMEVADGRIVKISADLTARDGCGLISDRTRFGTDGAACGRIDRPYVRVDGRFRECSWTEALMTAASKLQSAPKGKTAAFAGSTADCESMAALSDLMRILGSENTDAGSFYARLPKTAGRWRFCNTDFSDVAKADALLIIGADPEREAALLNAQIRRNLMPKAMIGSKTEQNYAYEYLGGSVSLLDGILNGTHPFSTVLKQSRFPMVVAGKSLWTRKDTPALFKKLSEICFRFGVVKDGWNGFNMTGVSAGMLGASELGLVKPASLLEKAREGAFDVIYLLGEDRLTRSDVSDAFVIYQGMFASETAMIADVILPGAAYTEKEATYVGATGKAKSTSRVLPLLGQSREDWKILRALSEYLEKPLPYDNLAEIRDRLGALSAFFVSKADVAEVVTPYGEDGDLSLDETVSSAPESDDNEICRRSASLRALKKIWKDGE